MNRFVVCLLAWAVFLGGVAAAPAGAQGVVIEKYTNVTAFRCESMTPLGAPVDPEVYRM